jgi:hypothetical protein
VYLAGVEKHVSASGVNDEQLQSLGLQTLMARLSRGPDRLGIFKFLSPANVLGSHSSYFDVLFIDQQQQRGWS